jgi:glycosyltransferase involved in cell wall biosynthesis
MDATCLERSCLCWRERENVGAIGFRKLLALQGGSRVFVRGRSLRVLFVTHLFPYPPTDGGRIGFFNPIKYLSRRMEVVLVSFCGSEADESIDEMRRYCLDVKVQKVPRSPYVGLLRGMFADPPGSYAKYLDSKFAKLIKGAAQQWNVDLVEFQCLHTAEYRRWVAGVPAILREHNVDYKLWERQAEYANSVWERIYVSRVAPRVKAYEARVAPQFQRCIMVSEADANHLRAIAPTARVEAIPSGVDTEYFVPDPSIEQEPLSIVMTGGLAWQPKQHNLRVLLAEVFPRIKACLPNTTLTVVGKGAPHQLRKLADSIPGVTMTGEVPDVRPYVHRAALAINYVESGGGIALKVLEAMAMRKPVLSTSLGCEGIKVRHGEDVFLADGAESFAEAAVLLLQSNGIRQRIAEGGHRLVKQTYAWDRLAGQFADCYAAVLSERQATAAVGHGPA